MTLPSDSGYGGSDFRAKMAGQGLSQHLYMRPQLETYDSFLPMPGSHHQQYRDCAQSTVSGFEILPDQSLASPLEYPVEGTMGHFEDDGAGDVLAFAGAGTDAMLPLVDLNMDEAESARSFPTATRIIEFPNLDPSNVSVPMPIANNMKRQYEADAAQDTRYKRSRAGSNRMSHYSSNVDRTPAASSQGMSRSPTSTGMDVHHRSVYTSSITPTIPQPQSYIARREQHSQSSAPHSHATQQIYQEVVPSEPSSNSKQKEKRKFSCDICHLKAFTTTNDLSRHRRTVHRQVDPGDKVWKCNIASCSASKKVWVRQDNFKQHVQRMHRDDDVESVDNMVVFYDPSLYDLSSNVKKSNTQAIELSTEDEVGEEISNFDVSMPLLQSPSQQRRDYTRSSTMSQRTSMRNHVGQAPTRISALANSQFPQPQQGLFPPEYFNISRMTPASVTNAGTAQDIQRELRLQRSMPAPMISSGGSQDLISMGEGVGHSFQGLSYPRDINLSPHSQPEAYGPGSPSHPMLARHESLLQQFQDLPPVQKRQMIQQLLNVSGNTSKRFLQRSAIKSSHSSHRGTNADQNVEGFACTQCKKSFRKNAELRKHERRHEKKYGCTLDNCFRKFGTKWEWKRHEQNQHVQQQEWRCDVTLGDGRICAQWFDGIEQDFVAHLQEQHHVSDRSVIQHKLETCVLGLKWIGSFWCGFCVKAIQNREHIGVNVPGERYKHISDHIDHKTNARKMEDWVEARGRGKTKAQIREAMHEASLRSPSLTGGTSPEDDSSSGGELEEGELIGTTTTGPPSLRLNIDTGMISGMPYSQNEVASTDTRRPSIVVTPADDNYETQNFYPAFHAPNEPFRPRSYSDQGHNSYPLPQYPKQCSSCSNPFLDINIGDGLEIYCSQCRNMGVEGTMEAFLHSEQMDDQRSAWQP